MDTEKNNLDLNEITDISAIRQACFHYYNSSSHQDLEQLGFLWTDIDEKNKGQHIDTILQNEKKNVE